MRHAGQNERRWLAGEEIALDCLSSMAQSRFMDYANGIKWARTRAGMTRRALAELVKVDESHVSMLESGKRSPSVELIESLAKACNVSTMDLLDASAEPRDMVHPKAIKAELAKTRSAALNRDEVRETYSGWDGINTDGGRLVIRFRGSPVDDATVVNLLNKLGATLPAAPNRDQDETRLGGNRCPCPICVERSRRRKGKAK